MTYIVNQDVFESYRTMQSSDRGEIGAISPATKPLYLIALGSNLNFEGGGPETILKEALKALELRGFVIRACSRFFNTPAFPVGSGPNFVNAAASVGFEGTAPQVLAQLHDVEAQMGRARTVRWGARTLDLDLIAAGSQVLPDAKTYQYWHDLPLEVQKTTVPPELILPHPRLAERAFVLVPLLEVAPEWCHPVSGQSVRDMRDSLSERERSEVVAL